MSIPAGRGNIPRSDDVVKLHLWAFKRNKSTGKAIEQKQSRPFEMLALIWLPPLPPPFPNKATHCCCCSSNRRNQYGMVSQTTVTVIWGFHSPVVPGKGSGRRKSSRARFPNISSLIKAQRDERSALTTIAAGRKLVQTQTWHVFIRVQTYDVQTGSKSETQRLSKLLRARSSLSLCT